MRALTENPSLQPGVWNTQSTLGWGALIATRLMWLKDISNILQDKARTDFEFQFMAIVKSNSGIFAGLGYSVRDSKHIEI